MRIPLKRLCISSAFPCFFLLILCAIQVLKGYMGWDFTHLGIYPLERHGLFGVFAHPLIHTGWRHLLYNSVPFFVLASGLYYYYKDRASTIFLSVWLIGGLLTWVIGKPGWHLGASGLIYSLAFFLLFSGIIRRHLPEIIIACIVFIFFSSMLWNMLPWFANANTSWEGHLDGAIAGMIMAVYIRCIND